MMQFLKKRWVIAVLAAVLGAGILYWYAKRSAKKAGPAGSNPNGASTTTTTTTNSNTTTLARQLSGSVVQN